MEIINRQNRQNRQENKIMQAIHTMEIKTDLDT